MNPEQREAAKEKRKEYWTNKYDQKNTNWSKHLHFAIFPDSKVTPEGFDDGLILNTELAAAEIVGRSSIYHLARGAKILDFGCGTGDLVFRLATILKDSECHGIDLSPTAIEIAQKDAEDNGLQKRVTFTSGGVEELNKLNPEFYDIIICRDMFYLLQHDEQQLLISRAKKALRPTGLFFLCDLTVFEEQAENIKQDLLERQSGGIPITWNFQDDEIRFSIQKTFESEGFFMVSKPSVFQNSVSGSYQIAADKIGEEESPEKDAYIRLSNLANQKQTDKKSKTGYVTLPYVKFFFSPKYKSNTGASDNISLNLKRDFEYPVPGDQPKLILREGKYQLPKNEWILIIGKSGIGKSTLLNLLSGMLSSRFVEVWNKPDTQFYLRQSPILIDQISVEDNISLYSKDKQLVNKVLTNLGLGRELRNRRTGQRLSGGEKQRVALGQALASNPDLLLLDEPCTGLDKVIKYQFFSLIKGLFNEQKKQQGSLICVDHDYHIVESFFDSIYEMNNGNLYLIKAKNETAS
ncbi:ABC-type Mn2+/Zn2+ transport system, ATPase component [Dyadobacter soli]|uniref:ABC-type Mn2+/Zn2+ transport system, ATPase component n=1 Tax=Dyadobacter soli TaxID=659014 RepID=A0A1G7MQ79_9BACT|nr:methyltransferase domain-containing protein [Dyadobacter soli]SDF63935.1 ABC-type Mn2+/Zn2+ transport system, ATPase component [Dyadobacter soli]